MSHDTLYLDNEPRENGNWWSCSKEDRAHQLYSWCKTMDWHSHDRFELYERNSELYDPRRNYQTGELTGAIANKAVVEDNIVKQTVDFFTALFANDRPKATFLTDGADWTTQRKALYLDRYIEGAFHQHKLYKKIRTMIRQAMKWGSSFLHVDHDGEKMICEVVLPEEILVDEIACRTAPPRMMVRSRIVAKEQVLAAWGDVKGLRDALRSAQPDDYYTYMNRKEVQDGVCLMEAIKLPSCDDGEDGLRVVAIPGFIISEETYTRTKFPYIKFDWTESDIGYFGISLIEEIAGTQLRVHKMHHFIDACQDRISVPRVYVHYSDLNMAPRLDRTIGALVPYTQSPPVFETPKGISSDYFQRLDQLRNQPLQQVGTNQAAMRGTVPSGIESAVAMREHNDIQSDRHTDKRVALEDLVREIAEHMIEVSRDLYVNYETDGEVSWKARLAAKKIKWSEVDPVADLITIQIAASSVLARGPAGRKALAQELAQGGLIDPDVFMRLLDIPDIDKEIDLESAMIDLVDKDIEDIRDLKSEADLIPAPDELADPQLSRKRVMAAYAIDKVGGAPYHVLKAYKTYIRLLDDMVKMAEEALMAEQAMKAQAGIPIPQTQGFTMPRGDLAPGQSPIEE